MQLLRGEKAGKAEFKIYSKNTGSYDLYVVNNNLCTTCFEFVYSNFE